MSIPFMVCGMARMGIFGVCVVCDHGIFSGSTGNRVIRTEAGLCQWRSKGFISFRKP
jgi:hypothetical protein